MKKSQFYWAWNNQELTPDDAMTRQRASVMMRFLKKEKRICRVAPFTYKAWTTGKGLFATMRTR